MINLQGWIKRPVFWFLAAALFVSLAALVIFFADNGRLSDEKLLILLDVLRYASYAVFVCALYIFIINIYNIIRKDKIVFCAVKILVSLTLIVWCFVIFYFESFIFVFSGGT